MAKKLSKVLTPEQVRSLEGALHERDLLRPLIYACKEHHVTLGDVLRGTTSANIVRARETCIMHLLSLGFSTVEVGRLLQMHHTSIMAARSRYEKRLLEQIERAKAPARKSSA